MNHSFKTITLATLLALGLSTGCSSMHHAEEKEGAELKVKLSETPKPVQDTLMKETMGAKKPVETVDMETSKDGTKVYEADAVLADGKNYEIRVAPDGKLISKKLDAEEGEKKSEKDEKEEKEEKGEKK